MKFTAQSRDVQQPFDHESLLHRITNRIRQSLELQEILEATVAEVRAFLGTDRVKVYRFDTDGCGEVIAESIHAQCLPSLLGLRFPADDIPATAREMFLKQRQRSIVDVASARIGLSQPEMEFDESPETENIYYRAVDPCHIEYLKAMGVQSSLVVPIVHHNTTKDSSLPQLWGLLVSHHREPRAIISQELKLVQQVADQVSIAISQSNLLAQALADKHREATINRITALLHALPKIQLQAALETAITAFNGVGGRLYIEQSGELYTSGDQPTLPNELKDSIIEQHPVWLSWIAECKSVWAVTDLYKEPKLRVLVTAFESTFIRGLLVIPLFYRQNFIGTLSIFRNEFDTEILWAGTRERNEQLSRLPQISFTIWREQKKGQALEWTSQDITLAQALCQHFSMAIQQQQMYQQVQGLNLTLESRVQQQTAELQKSLQLTKLLKQVTDQIRSTLNFKEILRTIVREVRKLLNTDRVLMYQFLDGSSGEVIVEDVHQNWRSVLGMKAPPECFPDEYIHLYLQGRVRAINNVLAASLSPCHLEFVQNLQVQANLIVPINMGQHLWGLLIAHQCHAPRIWQDDEIDVLQQLADQAAIAIEQAQLYETSRIAEAEATAKATQLEHTLQELQQTQTQLIQHEKMSSLGQLVAGVAHEINNPVNFIYGNLSHAVEYTEQILELLSLYQTHCPYHNHEIAAKTEAIDLDFIAEDLPKIMSSMRVGSERIRSIVLSLQNFSRLDQADMKAVNLHEGIDNTLLILQHRLKGNSNYPAIQVIKNYGDLPQVECYAGQINQVFMNILNNAIDALVEGMGSLEDKVEFSPPLSCSPSPLSALTSSPTIRISTALSSNGSCAIIRIADNGSGITEEVKKRMFDPFFTTKPIGKGTGLGLAISYQIVVEKHGGAMKCFSKPGQGTEFCIEIPLWQTSIGSHLTQISGR